MRTNLLLALVFAASTNCGAGQTTGGSGSGSSWGDIVESCATVDIGSNVAALGGSILGYVETVVAAGAAGWETALESIGIKYGFDYLTCALEATYAKLTAHPAGTEAPPESDAAKRAKSFEQGHNLSVKK
jgi:hypothetical protein